MSCSRMFGVSFAALLCACSVELGGLGQTASDPDEATQAVDGLDAPGKAPGRESAQLPSGPSGTPGSGVAPGQPPSSLDAAAAPMQPADAGAETGSVALPGALPDTGPGSLPPSVADAATGASAADAAAPGFVLKSPAFAHGELIPTLHTCDGKDVSPAFEWSGAPAGTQSFALVLSTRTSLFGSVVGFTRWAMWNIPASFRALPANIEDGRHPEDVPGARQVSNESDRSSDSSDDDTRGDSTSGGSSDAYAGQRYRGPCSYGLPQTFEFTLYALGGPNASPESGTIFTTDALVSWIETKANVLAQSSLSGVSP